MKSFCIKTNDLPIQNYLLTNLENMDLNELYFILRKFKCYENIIIHYTGKQYNLFLEKMVDLLTDTILTFYESLLLRRFLNFQYFYFDDFEKKIIEKNCYQYILSEEDTTLKYRKQEIWTSVLSYLQEHKSMILDGFVTFRLQNYLSTLEEVVDFAVNQYIIEKEYTEFINLLKLYIDSQKSTTSCVHLIYTNGDSLLLDSQKKVISLNEHSFHAKYLSDISFSSNDYALNALLTLVPQKIEIHLIGCEDEFIHTLKLIFGTRIFICTDCNICKTYRILNNVNFE